MIQVAQYPALTSSRTLGGYWRLENAYVFFTQTEALDSDSIPLFELT